MRLKGFKLPADVLLILIFIILGNVFMFSFKHNEKFIYYWDIAGYWTSCITFTNEIFNDFGAAMSNLYNSILYNDYTLLPVLVFIPVFRFLSKANAAFVLTTYNVYGVSFLVLMYAVLVKKLQIKEIKYKIISLIVVFTFTVFLTPLMGGFIDACGLVAAAAVLLLMEGWDLKKISLLKALLLALLILVLCFLRRWYSFWAVSFFIAYFVAQVLENGSAGIKNRTTINIFINLFISGAVWLAVLFLFFREFLIRVFSNNFSFAYSAYDFGGMSYNIGFIVSQTGALFIALSAIGCVLSLRDRKNRFYSVFLLLQAMIMLVMFTRIQSLGVQHLYLFVPAMIFFSVYAVSALPDIFKNKKISCAVYIILITLISLNFVNSYFDHGIKILNSVDFVFTEKKLYKRKRNDIESINSLIKYVNELSEKRKYVYLLSSSGIFNSDILKNADLPDKQYATSGLLYTYDVDKRDGFPDSFYTADIVIVTDPIQYHLDPADQRIVGVLAEEILRGGAEGTLEKVNEFALDDGVAAKVYEKKGPYGLDFIKKIDDRFKELYPEHTFLNNTISVYSYIYDLKLQAGNNIHIKDKYSFDMDLGNEEEGFKINIEGMKGDLKFGVKSAGVDDTEKTVSVKNDAGDILLTEDIVSDFQEFSFGAAESRYLEFEFDSKPQDSGDINVRIELRFEVTE